MTNIIRDRRTAILYKLISIGLYDAAHSLSIILGRPIRIKKPVFENPTIEQLNHSFDTLTLPHNIVSLTFDESATAKKDNLTVSTYPGQLLFLMDEEKTANLAYMYGGTEDLDREMIISAVNEVGNVMAGSILNAIANKLNFMLTPSLPTLHEKTILSELSTKDILSWPGFMAHTENKLITIHSAFIDKESTEIKITLFVFFFGNTYEALMEDIQQTIVAALNE